MTTATPRMIERSPSFHMLSPRSAAPDNDAAVSESYQKPRVIWKSESGSQVQRTIYSDGSTVVVDQHGTTFEVDAHGTYKTVYGQFELNHVVVDKRASIRLKHD